MRLVGRVVGREGLWKLTVQAGRIQALRPLAPTPAVREEDAPWMAPAFFDLQVNGFGGYDFNGPSLTPDQVEGAVRAVWPTGTGLLLATLISAPLERLAAAASTLARVMERGDPAVAASLAGIHLEGPYICPEDGPRGAHPREYVRPPDWDEFRQLQDAAGGHIRLVTLAPEMPGALPFIEKAVESGVAVAIGHTAASSSEIASAVAAGATLSTHLGNGCHAWMRRHPNCIWDQLAADELWATLIADGWHLPPAVLKSFVRAKGAGRCILISDAVSLAGMPAGRYRILEAEVQLTAQGKVTLEGTDYLAGSVLRLNDAVANVQRFCGVSLAEAVAMVTSNPGQALGLTHRAGHLRVGMEANLTVFRVGKDGRLEIEKTVVRGQEVYRSSSAGSSGG